MTADTFKYDDELLRLAEEAPEANVLICKDLESAEALVWWISENFSEVRQQ